MKDKFIKTKLFSLLKMANCLYQAELNYIFYYYPRSNSNSYSISIYLNFIQKDLLINYGQTNLLYAFETWLQHYFHVFLIQQCKKTSLILIPKGTHAMKKYKLHEFSAKNMWIKAKGESNTNILKISSGQIFIKCFYDF